MPVGFLSPLFLAGLTAVAIPIALHLMRRHADPVVFFGAMRLIRRTPVEQVRRRRLRELLLLALRCAALALLALSFARPYVVSTAASGSASLTVVAIDTSYSVSTPAQVASARALAASAIADAPRGGPVALVTFDDQATVLVPPTVDRGLVQAALLRVVPRPRSTRYAAALSAAADLLAGRGGTLVMVTDLQPHGWDADGLASLPTGTAVDVREVAAPLGNLFVRSVRRDSAGVVVSLGSTWPEPRATHIQLSLDGRAPILQTVTVPAHGGMDVPVSTKLPSSGGLHVSIQDPDGYAADNERFLVLDAPARPRVLLVSGEGSTSAGFYLERAIAAAEGDTGVALERTTADHVDDQPGLSGYAAIVVLGAAGLDRRGADALAEASSQGTGLVVVAGPTLDAARLATLLPPALGVAIGPPVTADPPLSLAATDVRHPVFESFGSEPGLLGSVRFGQFARLAGTNERVLARFSNGSPAIVEARHERGRVLVLASDVANGWNDLALHPAFVPLTHGLLAYVADARATAASYHVGEWPGLLGATPGIIEVEAPGRPGRRRIAVNVDLRESEDGRMTAAAFRGAVPTATPGTGAPVVPVAGEMQATEREQSLWRYGVMLMLAALVGESVVGRRS